MANVIASQPVEYDWGLNFSRESFDKANSDAIDALKTMVEDCKKNGKLINGAKVGQGKTVGEIIRFPVADGYAEYMVVNERPLNLIHIAVGDGYQIPDAHSRGLRLADIREMIEREKKLRELFSKKK